jgi:hypothetical protein
VEVKLTGSDKSKRMLIEALDGAQKGARARTIGVFGVWCAIERAEKKLDKMGIPKKSRVGCFVIIRPEAVSNSYRHPADSSTAELMHNGRCWVLMNIRRVAAPKRAYSNNGSDYHLLLSETATTHMMEQPIPL